MVGMGPPSGLRCWVWLLCREGRSWRTHLRDPATTAKSQVSLSLQGATPKCVLVRVCRGVPRPWGPVPGGADDRCVAPPRGEAVLSLADEIQMCLVVLGCQGPGLLVEGHRGSLGKIIGSYTPKQLDVLFGYFTRVAEAYQKAAEQLRDQ